MTCHFSQICSTAPALRILLNKTRLKFLKCVRAARNISLHFFSGSQQQVKGQARIIYHLALKSQLGSGPCAIDCSVSLLYHQPLPCNWLLSINI